MKRKNRKGKKKKKKHDVVKTATLMLIARE